MAAKRRKRRKNGKKTSPVVPVAVAVAALLLWEFAQAHPVLSAAVGATLAAAGVTGLVVWLRARRRAASRQAERDRAVESTDGMSGPEFEQWTARLLRRSGCVDVRVVGGAGDAGADVVATAPDGGRVVVQCKRYSAANKVGSEAVQRFSGTARYYHRADHALIVTTSAFTRPAQAIAAEVGIVLVDRRALAEWALTGAAPIALSRSGPHR